MQPDEAGMDRNVWMFPIPPVPHNDVEKPAMFVFQDMNDYKTRGRQVDAAYQKMLAEQKNTRKQAAPIALSHVAPPKPVVTVPPDAIGKQVKHKTYGEGTVIGVAGTILVISFPSVGEKKLGYEVCMKNGLLDFI